MISKTYLFVASVLIISCNNEKADNSNSSKLIRDLGQKEMSDKNDYFLELLLEKALKDSTLLKKEKVHVDLDYIKKNLNEFRGLDLNKNTLDDEKIEVKLKQLHNDPYVQLAILEQAKHWQAIIEDPENLVNVKEHYELIYKPQKCATYLDPGNLDYFDKIDNQIARAVYFNPTRLALWRIARKTLSGHSTAAKNYMTDENGNATYDHKFFWTLCPFEFKPGDRERYYQKWVDYKYQERMKNDWIFRHKEEEKRRKTKIKNGKIHEL